MLVFYALPEINNQNTMLLFWCFHSFDVHHYKSEM